MSFDPEKMEKLPVEHRFLDLNTYWYFANRWVVRFLYPLPITANQVTVVSLVLGMLSVACYFSSAGWALPLAGVLLYGKLFLDNVDGNLARARGEASRMGRFLDSMTDFTVTFLVFLAIAWRLVLETGDFFYLPLGILALISCNVQCSYFVFYLVNYTAQVGSYDKNRVDETITEKDEEAYTTGEISPGVYFLQTCHNWAYGWQDSLIAQLDQLSLRFAGAGKNVPANWYQDSRFMTLCSPLCLCTNTMLAVVLTLLNELELFLWLVCLENFYLLGLQVWKVRRTQATPGGKVPSR